MTWLKIADIESEDAPVTDYDIEMAFYNRLVEVLIQKGIDYRKINEMVMSHPTETRKDLALLNAALMNLGADSGIPRDWLVRKLEDAEKRFERDGTARDEMTWLKTALPGDANQGPAMARNLPTRTQPNLKGPVEKEMPLGPGLAPAGPVGPAGPGAGLGAPKPSMPPVAKPPMPGASPMGGPGGADGASEVKTLLDKGDLKAALEALKKLVPEDKPAAPGLGAPAPKPSFPPKKEGPAAGPEKKDEPKKDEKKPEDKKEASFYLECADCSGPLELNCPTCVQAKLKGPSCAKCEKSECACAE